MDKRKYLLRCLSFAASFAMCASAFGQAGLSYKASCQEVGNSAEEPLGDRDGHSIDVFQFTCRIEGGPLDGGVMTGMTISEIEKTTSIGLSGAGVIRKAGGLAT